MKKLLLGLFWSLNGYGFAANTTQWTIADSAYAKGNLSTLSRLGQSYPNDQLIGYLNALANLNRSNPSLALAMVNQGDDNYFRSDLMHQLLNYYFNNQDWSSYNAIYRQLSDKQVTVNETCGHDLANFGLNNHLTPQSDFKWLVANKMPLWCVSLFASKLNDGSLDKTYLQPFLYNLIVNEQLSQFNQLASNFKYGKVSFNANLPTTSSASPYQTVYRIANLSNKSPEQAYSELSASNSGSFTRQYLYNLIAADAASKLDYTTALKAIEKGSDDFIADDEYEWRVRSFLATNNWQQVADTIDNMPAKLQSKNSWLYWRAYAYGKLGKKSAAHEILTSIPQDYSYYALLAQSELHQAPNVAALPPSGRLSEIQHAADAQLSFDLYRSGKQNKSANFIRIATQNLYYIISQSNDRDIVTISQTALNYNWNEMSIYAGSKLTQKYASLSYPILYGSQYQKYSQQSNIEMSYPMAITRQESRFNPNALAFDGGVGLMQIMPATASYIAKKSGSSNCFKNYECNIKFGTWYLNLLYNQFGKNIIYSTAGYNAGPGRAHRWQQAFQSLDNRIQIELIPFKITRDYVQKVVSNKVVYDGRLDQDKPVDLLGYLNKINNHNTTFIEDDDDSGGLTPAPATGN